METDRGCLAPDAVLTSAIKHVDWAAVEQAKVDIVSGAVEVLTRKNRLPKGVWKIRK